MARFDRAIPPGGEGKVILTLKTSGHEGALNKSAILYSNDPLQSPFTLTLKASVHVAVSFRPKGVLLEGYWGNDIKADTLVRANEKYSLKLAPVELTIPEKVTYQIETVEVGKAYRVVFSNLSKQPEKYQGILRLKTNYDDKPEIDIGIFGYIRGDIEYRPEAIFFGKQREAKHRRGEHREQNLCRRTVSVSFYKGTDLEIKKVEVNRDLFYVRVSEMDKGRRYRLILYLHPEKLPQNTINEKMTIYTNFKDDPSKTIPIRVQRGFKCRP